MILLPELSALHLLRPGWLWALLLLPLLAWAWAWRRRRADVWRSVIDPHLLPHLLDGVAAPRRHWRHGLGLLAGVLAYTLAILALAGPSWRQVEQPLWQGRVPLVVALDLSGAMLAADPPPSRLAQARAKLVTLLSTREEGPIGLLAFAGDAFTVAPITDDAANVALFIDALAPDIMPVDGQRADRAIEAAVRLMRQAGFERGRILLMTGGADDRATEAAASARADGFEVAVLGLGRSGGVAYRAIDGRAASARFDEVELRRVASAGGGRYARLAAEDNDLESLGVLNADVADASEQAHAGSAWLDEGFWLLPPVMLLLLLAFRRGATLAVLVFALWLPMAPVQAADWWRRGDQVEHRRLTGAAEAYRREDYATAAEGYAGVDSATGHYNRGNALAKAGQYPQALEAYDRALQLQPGMEDAIANRAAVEAVMQRQPQQDGGGQNEQEDPSGEQDSEQQGGETPEPGPADTSDSQGQPDPGAEGESADDADRSSRQDDADGGDDTPAEAASADDREAQQAADEAQRQRMQQALEEEGSEEEAGAGMAEASETPAERERRIANEAWLRRVPDDPGGLLREKFRIEYERRRWQGGPGGSNR
ncbi:VWA domain-containing protein [Marilutibacter alkalisoli]|uniref:VWA domain-containing protein n=1 Tax=Marilutibacter alkalisoli TaxID=2591633 RepID=A0A514BP60_9GAMM|nr:VWA domain-containing protein [Lysobacter alkalisoli]QDH69178.1 VWA domain-containing protein [Lysobacter alkalisoli]